MMALLTRCLPAPFSDGHTHIARFAPDRQSFSDTAELRQPLSGSRAEKEKPQKSALFVRNKWNREFESISLQQAAEKPVMFCPTCLPFCNPRPPATRRHLCANRAGAARRSAEIILSASVWLLLDLR